MIHLSIFSNAVYKMYHLLFDTITHNKFIVLFETTFSCNAIVP